MISLRFIIDRFFIKKPWLRLQITRLIYGSIDTDISLLGVSLRINTVRENGYLRAAKRATNVSLFRDEVPILLTLAAFVPGIDVFVDIGANIGLFSTVLGRLQILFPNLTIIAFEADPETYLRLSKNLSGRQRFTYNLGVSSTSSKTTFVRGAVSHVTTTLANANHYSMDESFSIQCERLDSFAIEGERLMLKIDVEGQELQVLQGATRLFDDGRIAVVYIDGIDADADRDSIHQFFGNRGFTLLDGRSLLPAVRSTHSLLALHSNYAQTLSSMVR